MVDEADAVGEDDGLDAVAQAELLRDLRYVRLHRPVADEQPCPDLGVRQRSNAFGRGDIWVNGALFTIYHLHQPWSMPAVPLDGTFTAAYPSRRFRSTWIALAAHTAPSILIITVVLFLVL